MCLHARASQDASRYRGLFVGQKNEANGLRLVRCLLIRSWLLQINDERLPTCPSMRNTRSPPSLYRVHVLPRILPPPATMPGQVVRMGARPCNIWTQANGPVHARGERGRKEAKPAPTATCSRGRITGRPRHAGAGPGGLLPLLCASASALRLPSPRAAALVGWCPFSRAQV